MDSEKSQDKREKKLVDRLHAAIRTRNYSRRTEKSYWYWIRYFIFFHGKRHPVEMGAPEVTAFLSWLATERDIAAATQNQALSALLFLYKHVLGQDLPWLKDVVHAKRPVRVPTVLTESEVARLLSCMNGSLKLMASLLYGSGLRQIECLSLRVKDLDFAYRQITVRDGKGGKDRVTMLPDNLAPNPPAKRASPEKPEAIPAGVHVLHDKSGVCGFDVANCDFKARAGRIAQTALRLYRARRDHGGDRP